MQSQMPNLMPKVPLAHALPLLSAMLCVAPTLPRCGPQWFARRTGPGTKVLIQRCSESGFAAL